MPPRAQRGNQRLLAGKSASANLLGHEFGDVSANGHQFHADAKSRHEAPKVQPGGRSLKCHDQVCSGVEKQRVGKDRTTSEAVSEKPAAYGAEEKSCEQRRNEAGHARHAEQAGSGRGEDTALDDSRRYIARIQQVVEFEEKAKAEQDDELPNRSRGRKPVEPRGDGARSRGARCGVQCVRMGRHP